MGRPILRPATDSSTELVRYNLRLPAALKERLANEAHRRRVEATVIAREAIEEKLDTLETEPVIAAPADTDSPTLVTYVGTRTPDGEPIVWVEHTNLRSGKITRCPLRHVGVRAAPNVKTQFHSPSGFEWGYGGSGPADLALAILVDAIQDRTYDRQRAWPMHQDFKWQRIATLPRDASWQISQQRVLEWVKAWKAEHPHAAQENV